MNALLALIALLLLAAPADAARVRVKVIPPDYSYREDISDSDQFVRFRAGRGERNRVHVRKLKGHAVVIRDPGARLRPGRRCRRLSRHAVRCSFSRRFYTERFVGQFRDRSDRLRVRGPINVDVTGGEGNDVLVASTLGDFLRGGPGNDVLLSRAGYDTLRGGPGRDELSGGKNRDELTDGPGRDVVRGGEARDTLRSTDPANRDLFDGGPSRDLVTYASRRKPVAIALSSGVGEDDIVAVESVTGGLAGDVIAGDARANVIDGYGVGDIVRAGGGADRIVTHDAEDVTCGDGADSVDALSSSPLLRPDCETIGGIGAVFPAQPASVASDAVTFELPCTAKASAIRLITPPVRPWFTDGPFDTLVGTGTTKAGTAPTVELCPVVVELTEAGRGLPRPLPVTVKASDGQWAFLLP